MSLKRRAWPHGGTLETNILQSEPQAIPQRMRHTPVVVAQDAGGHLAVEQLEAHEVDRYALAQDALGDTHAGGAAELIKKLAFNAV